MRDRHASRCKISRGIQKCYQKLENINFWGWYGQNTLSKLIFASCGRTSPIWAIGCQDQKDAPWKILLGTKTTLREIALLSILRSFVTLRINRTCKWRCSVKTSSIHAIGCHDKKDAPWKVLLGWWTGRDPGYPISRAKCVKPISTFFIGDQVLVARNELRRFM